MIFKPVFRTSEISNFLSQGVSKLFPLKLKSFCLRRRLAYSMHKGCLVCELYSTINGK